MNHDLVVIGAGPGGYVAAIRAAQLGMNVGIVEREEQLGGTCLRVGCIPSKALLDSSERFAEARHALAEHGIKVGRVDLDLATMLRRKDQVVKGLTTGVDALMKKNRITRHRGHARLTGPGADGAAARIAVENGGGASELIARRVILATGSKVARLPGVELDLDRVATSTEALSWPEVPERLIVIGAGAIGLEMGSVWARLGAKVLVLELLDRILPGMDAEIAADARKILERQGLQFALGARVKHAGRGAKFPYEAVVQLEGGETLNADRVLVAVGRVPNTDELGLESLGIALDPKGRIPVDGRFQTSAKDVFAIGDVIRGPMLAHKAEEEGIACVEGIATGHGHVNYDAIPNVVYTTPEVAGVGKTEEELRAANVPFRKGVFQFRGNGRARASATIEGRAKVLAHQQTDRLLGVHVFGPHASELIAEAAAAITFHASAEDLARTCHAHPTLSEVLKEAALAVDGRAIHA